MGSKQCRGQSTHLSKSLSAVLTDSSRSPKPLPRITVFSTSHTLKQYSDSCTESSSSAISSWSSHQLQFTDGHRTRELTRTRARIALTVPKTWFAGGTSTAFLFRISILLSSSGSLALRVCAVIVTGLMWGALSGRAAGVRSRVTSSEMETTCSLRPVVHKRQCGVKGHPTCDDACLPRLNTFRTKKSSTLKNDEYYRTFCTDDQYRPFPVAVN